MRRRGAVRLAMATMTARAPAMAEIATATVVAVMATVAMPIAIVAVAVMAVRLAAMTVGTLPRRRAEGVLGDGDLLPRHLFNVAQKALLGVVAKRDGDAIGAGARGATDAMDVAFGHVGQL